MLTDAAKANTRETERHERPSPVFGVRARPSPSATAILKFSLRA